jgi:hypothetical protein
MRKKHPYVDNAEHTFWDRAISEKAVGEIDPTLGISTFKLSLSDSVMTMGSCFAQHVSQRLSNVGLNFLISENHPIDTILNSDLGYGVFTARYGNIYTISQAVQLVKRCLGNFIEGEIWTYKDKYVDSFRPRAVPNGFISEEELNSDKAIHLAATLNALKTAKVLVFTLGLTEGWHNIKSGQIYTIAPGINGGEYNPDIHKPFNMSASECISGLQELIQLVRDINPNIKFILTVSPVPLAATHTDGHVLTATFSSKAKLRVAAEVVSKSHIDVDYFPSFEIIQGLAQSGNYFEGNLREVTPRGVDHVMRVYFEHYYGIGMGDKQNSDLRSKQERSNSKILCDDDVLARSEFLNGDIT